MKTKVIVGIDLAGKPENPTGWALWKNKAVRTSLIYTDHDVIGDITRNKPALVAIDSPLSLPKEGILRKADKEMIREGYRVFPPSLPAMKKLTLRAIRLNKLITEEGYKTVEVHPTSTRKALDMPPKDWDTIQKILTQIGLEGDITARTLTAHEIDAVTAALTAYLHMQKQTERIGDEREGYIIIPKKISWSKLKV